MISFFVPVFNEEEILEKNITLLYKKLKNLKSSFELFIVDDSSSDDSSLIGEKLQKRFKEIKLAGYKNGPSRRENLAKSFSLAKGETIIFMDADLSVDLEHIEDLIKYIRRDNDIVIGSRYVKGAKVERSLGRRIISSSFRLFVKNYFNSKINDHECGFKAFKKEVILQLVKEMGYDKKFRRKMFWDTEMLIRAQKRGYKIKEIPVSWKAGKKSALRIRTELSMIPYILLLKIRLFKFSRSLSNLKLLDVFKIFLRKKKLIIIFLFFFIFLLIGISIYDDYGLSWDESINRTNGIYAYDYVVKGDSGFMSYIDRDYGVVVELPLIIIEKVFNVSDIQQIYLMRHLCTFLLFYFSVFCFYLICSNYFKSWKVGLVGSTFLILSPRIFAHSFYNSKDLAFLSIFTISLYTLIKYIDKKTWITIIIHSFSCAMLIDIRILGIIIPILTIFISMIDLLSKSIPSSKKRILFNKIFQYGVLLVFFTILFWPFLWESPIARFIEVFLKMRKFRWTGTVLYLGNYIKATEVPWHYIPIWISITTPIIYTFFFVIGAVTSLGEILKKSFNPLRVKKKKTCIFLITFFLPLFVIIMMKSVLYDAWRHMFFIYPAFLIISIKGLLLLFNFLKNRREIKIFNVMFVSFLLIIFLNITYISFIMIKYHPYQNVYFNWFTGKNRASIKDNFELDYWGLSYWQALEYILMNDSSETITISAANWPGVFNLNVLSPQERERIQYTDASHAKYFISNFRWHKEDYPYENEFHSIYVQGTKIMVVYKLKDK